MVSSNRNLKEKIINLLDLYNQKKYTEVVDITTKLLKNNSQ